MLKAFAIVVLAVLAMLCLGDLAQAMVPAGASLDCSRMCSQQSGCGTAASPNLVLPAATLPIVDVPVPPGLALIRVIAAASWTLVEGPVLQLASRSPPAAS